MTSAESSRPGYFAQDYNDSDQDFVAPESLVDRLTDMLRNDIVHGKIKPGEKITEVTLAERLGISRNPIREAVRRLEGTGLLVNHPRRGRFVREISRQEADDIFFFRSSIERAGIVRVAAIRTEADIERLRSVLAEMHTAAHAGDVARTMELDVSFHRTICEIAGSRRALRAFDDIHVELRILLRMIGSNFTTLEHTAATHEVLVDAVVSGDGIRADRAMAKHIDDAHGEVKAQFDRDEKPSPAREQ